MDGGINLSITKILWMIWYVYFTVTNVLFVIQIVKYIFRNKGLNLVMKEAAKNLSATSLSNSWQISLSL